MAMLFLRNPSLSNRSAVATIPKNHIPKNRFDRILNCYPFWGHRFHFICIDGVRQACSWTCNAAFRYISLWSMEPALLFLDHFGFLLALPWGCALDERNGHVNEEPSICTWGANSVHIIGGEYPGDRNHEHSAFVFGRIRKGTKRFQPGYVDVPHIYQADKNYEAE